MQFDGDQIIRSIAAGKTAQDRFAAVVRGVAPLGLDIVNYGFLDPGAAALSDAEILFLTTMSDGWMDHYRHDNLGESDTHVIRLKQRNMAPYLWGDAAVARLSHAERRTALEATEAGLRSAMCVPLASPLDAFTPVAAINFASSMAEGDFRKTMAEHGPQLTTIAHVLHNSSIRQLWQGRLAARSLTTRERDCLQYLADGLRQDAIAHALGLARITVETHLKSARQKLGARTPSEAVAKALVFGEITRE